MHVLFVHQNFPAQFQHVAPRLACDHGWDCTFVTARRDQKWLAGVNKVVYRPRGGATAASHIAARTFDNAIAHAHGVYAALKARPDVKPDLVVAHSGFGSSLFLPYLYDAPIINFFEYFYSPVGQDLGYRPETPVTAATRTIRTSLRSRAINCWRPTQSPNLATRIPIRSTLLKSCPRPESLASL